MRGTLQGPYWHEAVANNRLRLDPTPVRKDNQEVVWGPNGAVHRREGPSLCQAPPCTSPSRPIGLLGSNDLSKADEVGC